MKAEIYIEIPVKVTFSIDPGQTKTHYDPGFPPQIEDIDFDSKQALIEIHNTIFDKDSWVGEELMNIANDAAKEAEYDRAKGKI